MKKLLFTSIGVSFMLLASAHVPEDNIVDIRVVRSFSKAYKDVSDAEWTSLKQGGYVCRFTQNGITKRAFYDQWGGWAATIAVYAPDHLPAEVMKQVHSVYYDYTILCANEISMPRSPVVYLVQVKDKKTIRIVRVMEGEMEEIRKMEIL